MVTGPAGARSPGTTRPWPPDVTVMLLSGGGSRRLGRDKATAHVGGRRLIDRQLRGIPATVPVVLVGPEVTGLPRPVEVTREQPPGSGPLAGIGAGLARVDTSLVAVIAADMPFAVPVLREALAALAAPTPPRAVESGPWSPGSDSTSEDGEEGVDAVVPVDASGRLQLLCAAYRTDALRRALDELGTVADRPVRSLRPLLRVMEWPVPAEALADVDTEDRLRAARARVAQEEGSDMEQWLAAVREALGVTVDVDIDAILDVARDAAHAVERPAAPVTTFLLGAAVAGGADARQAATRIAELAADWPQPSA